MSGSGPKAEIFDVFLCHNSADKPVVREIAKKLCEENIKPWLDEEQIRPGTSWQTALGRQIKSIKSAAVFVGESGLGPWQNEEIQALLNQFVKRGCPVIPVVLPSAKTTPDLPWTLENLHCVDLRANSYPLKRLIWGITGEKPVELSDAPSSEEPATMREAAKCPLLPRRDDHGAVRIGRTEISEARLCPPLADPPDKEHATQLEIFRRRVMEYWVDGLLKHSLYREVLISLGKRQIDKAVDAPWKYTVEVSDSTNSPPLDNRDVSAIYDATGLLLILGEPGSGKTTTLLELAKTLLERARDDIKERVPVELSSWTKKQPLAQWISDELSEKYRVPRKIARYWLQHDYLLPLLDGLDEIKILTQPDCVAAINAFIQELNPSGVVVCCRLNEYRWLPERLKLNGAIRLEPLTEAEVAEYFIRGGPQLEALGEAVNTDSVLQELTQTPLMLSIMSLACQGAGGDELARQKRFSLEERRKQIFGLYVERMFQRKGMTSPAFPKEKIIGWLSWLAQKMREHSQSVFLVEEFQPSWLGTRPQRGTYGTVVALSLGLLVALFVGLIGGAPRGLFFFGLIILVAVGFGCWSKSPLKNGVVSGSIGLLIIAPYCGLVIESDGLIRQLTGRLLGGLFGGLTVGLIGGLGVGSLNRITLVETMSWKWNQFWERMTFSIPGSIVGLFVGLLSQLGHSLSGEGSAEISEINEVSSVLLIGVLLVPVLGAGVFGGLIGALINGLVGGFTDRVKESKPFPNQGIKLSWQNSLIALLVAWLSVWLLFVGLGALAQWLGIGPSFGIGVGLSYWTSAGLSAGLIIGLSVGLNRGGSAVIKHYALRLTLWRSGYTPFKFIKFLDQCAKLILLKKVGGGYIFIHRMLLEYFAELTPQSTKGK